MSMDHEVLPESPMYEVDLDSGEDVDLDFGYHSIGKNIQVNKNYNMFTVTLYGNRGTLLWSSHYTSMFNYTYILI